jgi:hypothetical protein
MRAFDEYDLKVTFFACPVALERNPEVGDWLRESGHEPCSPRVAVGGALAARSGGGARTHAEGN